LAKVSPGALPVGTLHLAYLLRFHNAVMNGGLDFAVEITDDALLSAAIEASNYFGVVELARFLERIDTIRRDDDALEDLDDDTLEDLHDDYVHLTEEDAAQGPHLIDRAFEARFAAAPADFEDGETV